MSNNGYHMNPIRRETLNFSFIPPNNPSEIEEVPLYHIEEKRLALLISKEIVDLDGVANPKFMHERLPPIRDNSKLEEIVNHRISPKAKPLYPNNADDIRSTYTKLFEKYKTLPCILLGDTLQLAVTFTIKKLLQSIKVIGEIEMTGSYVNYILGKEYYDSWMGESGSKEILEPEDVDFCVQTDQMDRIENAILDFFIPEEITEDRDKFRFLVRESAFKNINWIKDKFLISFSNFFGIDFDITFSKNRMLIPYSFCNGLIIPISTDFNFHSEIVPYAGKGINPAQCIVDHYIGILNGFHDKYNPREAWTLSAWTKGRRLFSKDWEKELAELPAEIQFQENATQGLQFVKIVETINLALLFRRHGRIEDSNKLLKELAILPVDHFLSDLFQHFKDPYKGLYHLYLVCLYALPFEESGFSVNGSNKWLALPVKFGTIRRTLYFSAFFNEDLPKLTKKELELVTSWIARFVPEKEFGGARLTPFLECKMLPDSPLSTFFALEHALFAKSYEHFFDLKPLKYILELPLYALKRINKQFANKSMIGFDRTERAYGKPIKDIAGAFIQDSMHIAPFALRRTAESLVGELKALLSPEAAREVLELWIRHSDIETARALLRYAVKKDNILLSLIDLLEKKPFWLSYRALVENASTAIQTRFLTFFSDVTRFKKEDKELFLDIFKTFEKLMLTNPIPLPDNYLEEAFKIADDLSFKKSALKIAKKLPGYFLYRKEFPANSPDFKDADTYAFTHGSEESKEAFEIGLSLCQRKILKNGSTEKTFKLLETLKLFERVEEFRKLAMNADHCCKILSYGGDKLFWLKAYLDRAETSTIAIDSRVIQEGLKDPSIINHPKLDKLLDKPEAKKALAAFLNGKDIPTYQKFFPKLEVGSVEERNLTSKMIQLYCNNIPESDSYRPFFDGLFPLAQGILTDPELAKNAFYVLLWNPDTPFIGVNKKRITKHIHIETLEPWKERFFEIAVETMYALLNQTPKNDHDSKMRLEIVMHFLINIAEGSSRRKHVFPILERVVFSPLSIGNSTTYLANLGHAQKVYEQLSVTNREYMPKDYKLSLVLARQELACPLEPELKLALFNEVLDFQIAAKLPEALKIICDAMLNSSDVIFKDNDEARMHAMLKIVDAAFAMPYERMQVFEGNLIQQLQEKINIHEIKSLNICQHHDIGNKPLLFAMIDSIIADDMQRICFSDIEATIKGPPLVKMVSERLLALDYTKFNTNDELVDIVIRFWERADRFKIFATETAYVELLSLCLSTSMLEIIFKTESWEAFLTIYHNLLTRPLLHGTHDARRDLFERFVKALLRSEDKRFSNLGKEFLSGGMREGFYIKKIMDDKELLELYRRA